MVDEYIMSDIRRLLKTFGVKADVAITHHLEQHPDVKSLRLRIRVEDLTEYPDTDTKPLILAVEGTINQNS